MNTFFLKVIASDKTFFSGQCQIAVLPALDGQKAVMAHHEDMVIATTIGELRFQTEEGEWYDAIAGMGFAQIIHNRMTVLVDTIEKPEEIDVRRAKEAKMRAEEQLRQKQSIQEYHHSKASLARAMSRLKISSTANGVK